MRERGEERGERAGKRERERKVISLSLCRELPRVGN